MRMLGMVAGLLGGLCWVVSLLVSSSGSLLYAVGAVLLVVGCLAVASGIARAPVLAAVVAVCATLLVGSLVLLVRDAANPDVVDAAVAVAAILICGGALARRPAPRRPASRGRGAHAR